MITGREKEGHNETKSHSRQIMMLSRSSSSCLCLRGQKYLLMTVLSRGPAVPPETAKAWPANFPAERVFLRRPLSRNQSLSHLHTTSDSESPPDSL